ncbi:MAG: prepilin-type N-terminal cleavage/methylation domain-containing protein [Bacilli bacterium]|nr:prepilin-type N-terminal cleavage/methylation domain-containing protein [Bacilli bacterium]
MNKKGFTLVEVLAVVLLLGLLALVVTPKVLEQKDKKENEITEAEKKVLYSDAGEYVRNNTKYNIKEGNVFCIKVNTLIEEDAISMDADDFKDQIIKITVDENTNFNYSLTNNCKEVN